MTTEETPSLSMGLSAPAEAPAGRAITRALGRAARLVTPRGPRTHRSSVRRSDLKRVLLIAPPLGSGMTVGADTLPPLDLVAIADSLRAAGFEPEIYDGVAASLGVESIRLHIEHSYPHVVAATAHGATSETAREVLRAAKQVVPGVLTVMLGAQPGSAAGKGPKDASVDYAVDESSAETLPGLLARLRTGVPTGRDVATRAA